MNEFTDFADNLECMVAPASLQSPKGFQLAQQTREGKSATAQPADDVSVDRREARPARSVISAEQRQLQLRSPQSPNVRDGGFLGAERQSYSPSTRLPADWSAPEGAPMRLAATDSVELVPIEPLRGEPVEDIVMINGIYTPPELTFSRAQYLANKAQARVIALHNAHDGAFADLGQTLNDSLTPSDNAATRTLANMVYDAVSEGRTLHLLGHSQGALIITGAIELVSNRLEREGLSETQIEAKLGVLKVETHAGAAPRYPDGPQYVHYVNMVDAVPNTTGVGSIFQWLNPLVQPGRGAVIRRFAEINAPRAHESIPRAAREDFELVRALDGSFHGPEGIYFDQRESFDRAYAEGSTSSYLDIAGHTLASVVWLPFNLIMELFRSAAIVVSAPFRDEETEDSWTSIPADTSR